MNTNDIIIGIGVDMFIITFIINHDNNKCEAQLNEMEDDSMIVEKDVLNIGDNIRFNDISNYSGISLLSYIQK